MWGVGEPRETERKREDISETSQRISTDILNWHLSEMPVAVGGAANCKAVYTLISQGASSSVGQTPWKVRPPCPVWDPPVGHHLAQL